MPPFEREPEPMLRHRTTARALLFLLATWASAGTAQGAVPDRIIFPVVGPVTYQDDFGDPRGQGGHQANDIMATRKAPAVAAEGGRVSFWTTSARAGCMLYLYGRSGTTYLYIHLNNDLTMRNDNRAGCKPGTAYAPGLKSGERVGAGQLIGYVGDSGDANGIHPHLHFELHPNGGRAVSPYSWLRRGRKLLFAVPKSIDSVQLKFSGHYRSMRSYFQLRIQRVTTSSGWSAAVAKNVALAVPPGTLIERDGGAEMAATSLAVALPGERVTVWSTEFAPTLKAQLGRLGALSSARIVLRGLP
ncbi:MAG TPA: M23 family metallopeptidase [Gaiellaceae bacterium]|nr:M23 family metallopeptidase [Gaiellaceae bacterium]